MESRSVVETAGFWRRFNAYGIDATIVLVVSWLLSWQLGIDAVASDSNSLDMQTLAALVNASQSGTLDPALIATTQDALTRSLSGGSFIQLVNDQFFMLISALYNIFFIASEWQATPGKRWLDLKVTNADGTRLTPLQSAMRHAASGLSMLAMGLGYITMFFTKDKLALHDIICTTRVIRLRGVDQ